MCKGIIYERLVTFNTIIRYGVTGRVTHLFYHMVNHGKTMANHMVEPW